jgi:DNA helicase-2/ATP-dependent DNA helicase PcrA
MQKYTDSPQQIGIFSWIENDHGSAIIEAVAGAGKTTTLIKSLELMLKGSSKVFLGAYNKKIADEIKEKAPQNPNLFVSTMHGAGFAIWRKAAPRVRVDNNKCRNIYRAAIVEFESSRRQDIADEMKQFESQVLSLVSYAKQAAVGFIKQVEDDNVYFDLIDHFDIDCLDNDSFVVKMAKKLLKGSFNRDMEVIDFDDMILAPLVHKARPYTYDWVLIDEAQDTNASRRALALMMLKKGGRLVAVGDPRQAIYGFTGADSDALDLIAKAVNAKRLPLTVTYRCPKAVVKYAQNWVTHIEAHETAPEGIVRNLGDAKISDEAKPGDAILCRFNAPLIQQVYEFIAAGIPAKVEGREIGTGLKALARRWKVKSFDAMQVNLENFVERETGKFRAKEEETKAVAVEDKVNCLFVIMDRAKRKDVNSKNPVEAVCAEVDSIFSDKIEGGFITLASIHKSKGREWNRVFWMQTGPSKWARQAWELEQEDNLCYVAATRAKSELVLFPAPAKDAKKESAE